MFTVTGSPQNYGGRHSSERAATSQCESRTYWTSLCFMRPATFDFANTEGLKPREFESGMWTGRTITRCPAKDGASPTKL